MAKRFNFNDDEDFRSKWQDQEDDDEEYDDDDIDWENSFELDGNMLVNFELKQQELDQDLLKTTINFLSQSFFWKFRKIDTKLKMIKSTYEAFRLMTQDDESEDDQVEETS
jgi:hypothetical protein